MAVQITTDPIEICERKLRDKKASNIEHSIWPSENIVIDRLLERRTELTQAYAEIYEKLHRHAWGIYSLFNVVLRVTVLWNSERVADAREARSRLEEINREIAELAQLLAVLIDERSELSNTSGFASDTHHRIVDVIEAASSENGLYRSYLKKELKPLATRYDFKYWPSLADILQVIGQDADFAATRATDPLTRAAAIGTRGSKADFFKALFVSLEENNVHNHGHLPRGFKLSDETLASLANCVLDLSPDAVVDSAYVKRLRQRQRETSKAGE